MADAGDLKSPGGNPVRVRVPPPASWSPVKRPSLLDLYLSLSAEEGPIELEPFLERLRKGEFGPYSAEEIRAFLDQMYENVVASLYAFAEEHPGLDPDLLEQRLREEFERFQKLRERMGV